MGVLLGLAAALGWGVADFMARFATRQVGAYRTIFYMQFVGLAALSLYLIPSGELARAAASASGQSWTWAFATGVLNMLGGLALYRAFEIGVLTIVSPIAASYAALTFALALFSGETIDPLRTVGICVTLAGVALAATSFESRARGDVSRLRLRANPGFTIPSGVGWAVVAAISFGVSFWMLGFHVTPELGRIAPVWIVRLTSICGLPLLALPLRQSIRPPSGQVWWLVAGVGVFDTGAYLALNIGLTTDQVAVVSVLASLFTAVTVLLAWVFLRERPHASQWLGVFLIFVGVALVSL
jgi:drug/metabolite transporter (DMT)-like permease